MANDNQNPMPGSKEIAKGARAPVVTVTPNVPLREGARAPIVVTPANVPRTSGPISVTKPKN